MNAILKEALLFLQLALEEKISSLKERVDMLAARLACLEESFAGTSVGIEADIQGNVSHDMEVHHKLESLSKMVESQQKVIELQEREGRKENVAIIGLKEEREEDSAATVKDFLKKELDLDDVHITKAFRLGKGRSSGDRPVLVRFNSQGEKARVMKEKRKLRSRNSKVFINHD